MPSLLMCNNFMRWNMVQLYAGFKAVSLYCKEINMQNHCFQKFFYTFQPTRDFANSAVDFS